VVVARVIPPSRASAKIGPNLGNTLLGAMDGPDPLASGPIVFMLRMESLPLSAEWDEHYVIRS
jgi:hypothetical protein